MFFYFFKIILTPAHQNGLKILKNINYKQRKKLKNFKYFLKYF